MDPSNNNSFGSSQVPGAIVSDENTAVDNTAMNNTSGGFTSTNFPAGGITVGESSGKGPRKGLIIGVIVAFVLLLGGGLVALAVTSGMFGGGNSSGNSQESGNITLRESFNQYINYATNGEDSSADITDAMLIDLNIPYFLQVEVDNREDYLKKIRSISEKLSSVLGEDYSIEMSDMNLYFISFAEVYPMGFSEVEELYLRSGYEGAQEMIRTHFDVDATDPVFEAYINAARELALYELEIVSNAAKSGCVENGAVKNNCYTMTEDEKKQYNEKYDAEYKQEELLASNALDAVNVIYESAYIENGDNNE